MPEDRSTTVSRQQTLQQQRASHAWHQIAAVEKLGQQLRKDYGSLVRGLPAMIQRDGLGPVLAFLQAKGKENGNAPHNLVAKQLGTWVHAQLTGESNKSAPDLLEWLMQRDSVTYRRATSEAQAYLLWLKRFAEAKDWSNDAAAE